MAKIAMQAILLAAVCLAFAQAYAAAGTGLPQSRKMLQTTPALSPPVQQVLTDVLCLANQAVAASEQFASLTGGQTGLPLVLSNSAGTANNILVTLEQQLGINPATACAAAPPPPSYTIDDAIKSLFCATQSIVNQLEAALGLDLPPAYQTAIQYDIAQLSNATNSIEAGLIEFLFNIKC